VQAGRNYFKKKALSVSRKKSEEGASLDKSFSRPITESESTTREKGTTLGKEAAKKNFERGKSLSTATPRGGVQGGENEKGGESR